MFFQVLAYVGTALSIILFLCLILGVADLDLDGMSDSDMSFKVFSLQNISYFSMTGGWMGVWSEKQGHDIALTVILFVIAGLITVLISQLIMVGARRLNHIPTVDYDKAVGTTGRVTVSTGPQQPGKVQIVVSGKLTELTASSKEIIASGETVRVEKIINNNELFVA